MSSVLARAVERIMVVWVPDWPVHAHLRELESTAEELPGTPAIALIANRRVVACSAAARAEGVRAGLRESEAQSRCPTLAVRPHDPEVDERRFAPVLASLERLTPGVEPTRPGLCTMRARGPARYYGGEEAAAEAILSLAADLGLHEARVGIADGRFAAEQAARAASTDPGVTAPSGGARIVPAGVAAAFLSGLPVGRAAEPALTEVLHGLGIRTLGALAALPEDAVRQRFGPEGVAAHRRASVAGPRHGSEIRPRAPVRELAVELSLEPPVDSAEQLAFACMALAERFVSGLAEDRLVCTALRVELTDDIGVRHERVWSHPHRFTAADAVNRVRWQLSAMPAGPAAREDGREGAGIARVRLAPAHTDRVSAHEPGLWATEPDARVHHHLSRVQSRLGHTGVGTAELAGGRLLAERQRFVPWSTGRARPRGSRGSAAGPWPGAVPGPTPSLVFPEPIPAELCDGSGRLVGIDDEDLLTARPARLRVGSTSFRAPVSDWSLPWPVREQWWRGAPERFRLQLQLADGDAWMLLHEGDRWYAEGRYD
ncbi:DNA polymerase Y family protein [Leucobacter sp. wl10]|uniref:DNA polymerase Y family protein n=1 Tax=Leucobacter sp. wl10 TaxID=2304677 RepID=UPI000E5BE07A|nr:DNA polymerase Y family protein [Leucobacter sp. wl10]RGE21548.1 DNA polymerase Y family protein [Leucobacter sp. wl10]